jgi:exosortase D (VPLPA-CTERM-specific)
MTAYLFKGPLWQRLLIVASTIPITIFMNSVRIAVTGALVQAYGTAHAEGALHFFEGWVVFVLCLAALFGVVVLLCLLSRPRRNPFAVLGGPELSAIAPSRGGARPGLIGVALAGGLTALLIISSYVSTDTLIVPERRDFAGIPSELPEWQSKVRPLDPEVAEVLGADDTIVVDLISPEGDFANVYLAYLEAQRDGRSWHSPRQCIPGGGWQIVKHTIEERRDRDGAARRYNRLIIQYRDYRQLVYYWYDQRGRDVANEFVMKFWLIYDAVTRKRSDGAMVRLITPITKERGVAEADSVLQNMQARMDGFLPAYIPE